MWRSTGLPGSRRSRYCCSPSAKITASYWPDGSDSAIIPILLPVLVRRSARDSTVAATLPAVTPDFTAREKAAQDCTCIVVERMTGEEKPDGIVFALQPLRRQPARHVRNLDGLGLGEAAEQFALAAHRGVLSALRGCKHDVDRGGRPRPVALQLVEGAGGDQ